MKRLTDAALKAYLSEPPKSLTVLPDGAVAGLSVRLGTGGAANWSLLVRVTGEGGLKLTGKQLLGRKYRVNLGGYPEVGLAAARTLAISLIDQAKRGVNPKAAMSQSATAGGLTVRALSEKYLKDYVGSRQLDSIKNYELAFSTHINPIVGDKLAELLTREDARDVMNTAREKRARPKGQRGGGEIGGVEAARTAMSVLRQMYSWAMEESVLKRQNNPASKIQKNLPKKKTGEIVLTLREARIVWQAAQDCGYPFGTHAQLMMLSGCRLDEWASAEESWIDVEEGLSVVPSDSYKTDHVHVVPLVSAAIEILRRIPKRTTGVYILSSMGGSKPIQGIAKFFNTRLKAQIIANTGSAIAKKITSHTLRRTVATRIAEVLGDEGDKLIKRVLGHSDGSVTAIYNRYGYVREMRRALEAWAAELLSGADVGVFGSTARSASQIDQKVERRPTTVN
ncbi:MAG TPA: tyrosine-type recombinase/integrase [Steroidobacteraceae bacterium]|nr:tyrosine-type recombinase/integrase [Steroidobacteraceae bacterium]